MEGTWDSSPDGRRWAGVDSSNPEESERHEIQPASQPAREGGREGLRKGVGKGSQPSQGKQAKGMQLPADSPLQHDLGVSPLPSKYA